MPKKIDWDGVTRKQRAQRHGSAFAYDELPPVGSYADQARYISDKPKKSTSTGKVQSKAPPRKTKPSRDERLHNLRKTLQQLLTIPNTSRWGSNGQEYQRRLLAHISGTLSSLIKLDPSSSSECTSLEATRLLAEYSRRMTPTSIAIPIPESIRRITDSPDRALAWQFFVFFARFEYALKRHTRYLKAGSGDAEPNWDKFGSEHNSIFRPASTPNLDSAVSYFLSQPPRKQLRKDSVMSWSEPQFHDGKEPLLIWLLRMIRCVRNNLFHGGKFPLIPVSDPSHDRDLLLNAMAILNVALALDSQVEARFAEGLDE